MKKIGFFSLLLIAVLALSGCSQATDSPALSAEDPGATGSASQEANQPVTPKKFYPQTSALSTTDKAEATAPGGDFTITQELLIQLYLADKYDPGICYGAPAPVPEVAVSGMIERNPELAQFLKERYNLSTDLAIYEKVKQLNGIQLTKLSGGLYRYNFTDGQCCSLAAYEGQATIVGQKVSDEIINKESKTNPC